MTKTIIPNTDWTTPWKAFCGECQEFFGHDDEVCYHLSPAYDEEYETEASDTILAQQELEDFEQADEWFGDFGSDEMW